MPRRLPRNVRVTQGENLAGVRPTCNGSSKRFRNNFWKQAPLCCALALRVPTRKLFHPYPELFDADRFIKSGKHDHTGLDLRLRLSYLTI